MHCDLTLKNEATANKPNEMFEETFLVFRLWRGGGEGGNIQGGGRGGGVVIRGYGNFMGKG